MQDHKLNVWMLEMAGDSKNKISYRTLLHYLGLFGVERVHKLDDESGQHEIMNHQLQIYEQPIKLDTLLGMIIMKKSDRLEYELNNEDVGPLQNLKSLTRKVQSNCLGISKFWVLINATGFFSFGLEGFQASDGHEKRVKLGIRSQNMIVAETYGPDFRNDNYCTKDLNFQLIPIARSALEKFKNLLDCKFDKQRWLMNSLKTGNKTASDLSSSKASEVNGINTLHLVILLDMWPHAARKFNICKEILDSKKMMTLHMFDFLKFNEGNAFNIVISDNCWFEHIYDNIQFTDYCVDNMLQINAQARSFKKTSQYVSLICEFPNTIQVIKCIQFIRKNWAFIIEKIKENLNIFNWYSHLKACKRTKCHQLVCSLRDTRLTRSQSWLCLHLLDNGNGLTKVFGMQCLQFNTNANNIGKRDDFDLTILLPGINNLEFIKFLINLGAGFSKICQEVYNRKNNLESNITSEAEQKLYILYSRSKGVIQPKNRRRVGIKSNTIGRNTQVLFNDDTNLHYENLRKRMKFSYAESRTGFPIKRKQDPFNILCADTICSTIQMPSTLYYPVKEGLTINLDEILGNGTSSTVYKGVFNRRDIAVKLIRYGPQGMERYIQEAQLLFKYDRHENIVKCFNYWFQQSIVLIALELCSCTVEQWIKEKDKFDFRADPVDVLWQATKGVEFLHLNDILHLDIAPQNILMSQISKELIRIKIADFGNSMELPIDTTKFAISNCLATKECISPELLKLKTSGIPRRPICNTSLPYFNILKATDIFSLGCVFYFVLTKGMYPFEENQDDTETTISRSNPTVQAAKVDVDHMGSICLIFKMLDVNPNRRPTASALLKHHLFWQKKAVLCFLAELSNIGDQPSEGSKISKCVDNIENSRLLMLYCEPYQSRGWIRFLCPDVQMYVCGVGCKRKPYNGDLIFDLLRAIRNMHAHYTELPANVKTAVGPLHEGFAKYWLKRFPVLIDVVWFSLECLKNDKYGLSEYYCEEYNFSLGDFSEQEYKVLLQYVKSQCIRMVLHGNLF